MTDTMNRLTSVMARRCDLQNPDVFAKSGGVLADRPAFRSRVEESDRGTGRTTRMLLEALVCLGAGARVNVVAADDTQARYLRESVDAMALAAGLAADALDEMSISCLGQVGHEAIDIRMIDHFAQEQIGWRSQSDG